MKKLLWADCETGGTDEKKDALLQLSAIIEIDNKIVDEIDLKMKPIAGKRINAEALEVQGRTMKDIEGFDPPRECFDKFYKFLQREPKSKENRSKKVYGRLFGGWDFVSLLFKTGVVDPNISFEKYF